MTPFGRNEDGVMSWVKLHDLYEDYKSADSGCH